MSQSESSGSDKNGIVFRRDGEVAYPLRVKEGFLIDADGVDVAMTPYTAKIADALNELNEWRSGKRSAPSAERSAVPDGWVLVPIEPTDEMMRAIENGGDPTGDPGDWRAWARGDWANTLKHVPEAPVSSAVPLVEKIEELQRAVPPEEWDKLQRSSASTNADDMRVQCPKCERPVNYVACPYCGADQYDREGFYEKLWKDFVSLQRGDAVGIVEKVERYYREQASESHVATHTVTDEMVNRFLSWKLPVAFHPDAGISFKRYFNVEYNAKHGKPPQRHEPMGTNLLTATQAREMLEHVLAAAPSHATTIDAKLLDALRWDAVRYEEIVYILMNGGAISFHRARLEWVILRPDGGRSSVSGSLSTILDDGIRAGGNAPPSATTTTEPAWIDWKGGECPVPAETRVEYRLRDGFTAKHHAGGLHWPHDGSHVNDIVEYRVVDDGTAK
jgi:hypothetical protein